MIFKFQQGGATPPFVAYQPVIVSDKRTTATQEEALAAKATKESESGKLSSKDLYTMLKEKLKGLPNDVNIAMNQLQQLEQLTSMDFDGSFTQNIESKYLSTLQTMNQLSFSREQYDKALDNVKSNGGLNEAAINQYGQVYMTNGKDYKLMSPEEAKQSGWKQMTNQDLLYLRANDPSLSGKDAILNVVNNGIGISQVTKMIQDSIGNLGTNSNSETAYATTQQGQLIQGLNDFIKAAQETGQYDASIEDLYKAQIINKTQAQQAQQAIAYIYKTLPQNAKSLLKTRTQGGTDKEALNLISTLVLSKTSEDRSFTVDLEGGPTKKSMSKDANAGNKDDTELKTSLPLQIMQDMGGADVAPVTIDKGDGVQMSVYGSFFSAINDKKGEPIVNTSLQNMLAQSGLQDIVKNVRNITFGDQKLTPEQLSKITYNNTGIVRADLPVNEDGTVKLSVLDDFNAAMNEIKGLGNASKEQVEAIKAKYHLDQYLKDDGTPDPKHTAPFMLTEGYTTEKNGIEDTAFVKHIKNPTDDQIQLIKDSLTVGTGKDAKVPDIDTFDWYNPFDWFGTENIYKATIYIPISNNVGAAVRGGNQNLDYNEALKYEMKYRNFQKMNDAKTTSADVL